MLRRQFLQLSPTLLALPALTPHLRTRRQNAFRVALIGCGWYGKSDLMRLIQVAEVEVVGLCDVDRKMLEGAGTLVQSRLPGAMPKLYRDYQKMLDEEKPDLVLIATPDHWHALTAIAAIESGAHLYLQKPVGVDVRECEAILDAARKHDRIVQVGLQRRSTPHLVEAKRRLSAGEIGEVHHVEMACYYHMRDTKVREEQPVPDHFDYDAWTGPAPLLPYKGLPHRRWRSLQAYGNGIVGDMCVHMYDMTRWLLDLGWPARVSSHGGIYVQTEADATIPDTQTATFEHPDRNLNCVWTHRTWGEAADPEFPWSAIYYGSKGTMKVDVHKFELTVGNDEPEIVGAVYEREEYPEDTTEEGIEIHTAPATRAHMQDWLAAIDLLTRPIADIEEGYISSAACILANLSLEAGMPLSYNPETREVTPGAGGLLAREYRVGYSHPGGKG